MRSAREGPLSPPSFSSPGSATKLRRPSRRAQRRNFAGTVVGLSDKTSLAQLQGLATKCLLAP